MAVANKLLFYFNRRVEKKKYRLSEKKIYLKIIYTAIAKVICGF